LPGEGSDAPGIAGHHLFKETTMSRSLTRILSIAAGALLVGGVTIAQVGGTGGQGGSSGGTSGSGSASSSTGGYGQGGSMGSDSSAGNGSSSYGNGSLAARRDRH
jgi:hypothetical protein